MDCLLQSLFGPREFWAAIVGAVIGGLFAVVAQLLSSVWQSKSERSAERRVTNGILQAVTTELEVFKVKYPDAFARMFDESQSGIPKVAMINQNVFSVFDSNAAALGRITDPALRRKIVSVYTGLKAIVDTVNHYSQQRTLWSEV